MTLVKDKKKLIIAILSIGIAIVLFIFFAHKEFSKNSVEQVSTYKTIDVLIGKKQFKAEIADTEELQEHGLSDRTGLSPNRAMLFVFPKASRYAFWMKDMQFSIDIVWLDENGAVIMIAPTVAPETYPGSFAPDSNSLYVIELPSGTAAEQNIKKGDTIIFDKNLLKNTSI